MGRPAFCLAAFACIGGLLVSCSSGPVQQPGATTRSQEKVPVPEQGAYWGIHIGSIIYSGRGNSEARRQLIEAAEVQMGRRYDIDHQFFRWGDQVINDYVRWTSRDGRYAFISLNALRRDGTFVPWAEIADGGHDDYLKLQAQSIADWGDPAFFSFHHEPENEICPGDTLANCDLSTYYGTTAQYREAWQRIVKVFEEAGVGNLSYVWISTGFRYDDPADYRYGPKVYPGDGVIDWLACDPYNFIITPSAPADFNGRWSSLADIIENWYAWGSTTGKPLMLGQFGSLEDPQLPGRRAAWFEEARRDLKRRFPAVKALNYYDNYPVEDPGNDWRLFTGSADALVAYRNWGLDPYFNPRSAD